MWESSEIIADYVVDNCVYRITDTQEVHLRLQEDPQVLENYLRAGSTAEFIAVVDDNNSISESPSYEKFKWDAGATIFFLEEYRKRSDKFRDRNIKKKSLWSDILHEMRTAGFHIEDEDSLDRKMRNMRKTYKNIKDNINNTGRGRVGWTYYNFFEDIFATDCTVNIGPSVSSMTHGDESTCLEESNSSAVSSQESNIQAEKLDACAKPSKKSAAGQRMSSLQYMRKQQLQIEERKLILFESMTESLKETNNLLRERNELPRHAINGSATATTTPIL